MRIEHPHRLSRDEARTRIDRAVEDLLRSTPPAGVEVTDARHAWSGNRLEFSFRAKRGFLGTALAGTLDVEDDRIVLEAELPGLLTSFVGEDRIRKTLTDQLERLLG